MIVVVIDVSPEASVVVVVVDVVNSPVSGSVETVVVWSEVVVCPDASVVVVVVTLVMSPVSGLEVVV